MTATSQSRAISSSFLALQAAAVAIAAETPHTDMSAEITMLSDGEAFLVFSARTNMCDQYDRRHDPSDKDAGKAQRKQSAE